MNNPKFKVSKPISEFALNKTVSHWSVNYFL